jgi:hypothetical protein
VIFLAPTNCKNMGHVAPLDQPSLSASLPLLFTKEGICWCAERIKAQLTYCHAAPFIIGPSALKTKWPSPTRQT